MYSNTREVTRFVYDANGNQVKQAASDGTSTIYIGQWYEESWKAEPDGDGGTGAQTRTCTNYYYLGGQRVALRRGGVVYYLHADHLGSLSEATTGAGGLAARQRYWPYGQVRYLWGSLPTTYNFTGQRLDNSTGLLYYGARYYDPTVGRFIQADTLVPDPANPQSLNRYAYVLNNPLRYTDPTGMFSEEEIMAYFGVSTWEEVLALFERGGIYEGRWGWLETLRQAEAGTQVTVLDDFKVEGCNEWTGECQASATPLFQGTFFIGDDGKIYLKQESGDIVPAEDIAWLGTAYSLDNPNATPLFRYALIEAYSKTYHVRVNWNKALDPLKLDELAVFTYATFATGATTITLVGVGLDPIPFK